MTDSFTIVSQDGLGERLMRSVGGAVLGVVLFFASFVVLWWNEGNVVAEKNALEEMRRVVVKGSVMEPRKAHNGRLIHATARLDAKEKLGDNPYLKAGPYLVLERHVEMYQWVEHEQSETTQSPGGSTQTETTYTYRMEWAEGRKDSSQFQRPKGHTNPPLNVEALELAVKNPRFGKVSGKSVLERIYAREPLKVTRAMVNGPHEIKNGMIYLRKKPGSKKDALGDVRISYRIVKPGVYSVMARQIPKGLAPFTAKNGKEKFLIEAGNKAPPAMIESAKQDAQTFAMIVRVVGFAMMWFGMMLVAAPLTTLFDVIPFIGNMSRFMLAVMFFVTAATLSSVTIGLAMIAHNPIALVVFLAALIGGGYYLWQRKKASQGLQAQGAVAASPQPTAPPQNRAA